MFADFADFADFAKAVELLKPSSKLLKLHVPLSTGLDLTPGSADETEATRAAVHSHVRLPTSRLDFV
jgi:hypothetical protein